MIGRTADAIKLKHNIQIQVRAASMKNLRGPTYIGVLLDELAFWYTEETNASPDSEVLAAVTPGLLTTRGLTVMASSPYRRKGVLWEKYKKHFGPDGAASVLVAQGSTRIFNPTIEQAEIDRLLEDDPAKNSAEYLAQFRTDLESLVAREIVESCVEYGCFERSPRRDLNYFAFCDPSTGSGKDSFTVVIAHMAYGKETVTIDAIREAKPPFSPEQTCKEFAELMLSYGVSFAISDKFAGEFVVEQMGKFGIRIEQSAKAKSELYLDLLATLMSGRVELLDNDRAANQIVSLERRNRSGGRASIDAPPNAHEDIANAIAGVVSISLFKYGQYNLSAMGDGDDQNDSIITARRLRQAKASSHWPEFDHTGRPMVNYAYMFREGS